MRASQRSRLNRFSFMVFLLCLCLGVARASAAPVPSSGYVEVKGGRLFYEARGEGHPVVLIHGGNLDRRMWDDQFEALAGDFQVIRYDVRGYGKSELGQEPYSEIEDLYSLFDTLQIDKAYLVGLSLGGRIAIDFVLAHPEKVDGLVLAGPGLSGFNWSSGLSAFWARVGAAQEQGPEAAVELWLQDPYMTPAMENPAIAGKIRQLSLGNAHIFLSNPLLARQTPPAIEQLGEIQAPTLIIVGDRDVPDIHAICGILDVRIAGARKVVVRGSGHMVNMEKPAEFNRAVLEFLRGL